MSITKKIVMTLSAIAEGIEQSSALNQEMREKETIAHMRNERHDKNYCELCINEETDEYELQECKKHDFGECKANCRYRTGVVEDCTWHVTQSCAADCSHRKA